MNRHWKSREQYVENKFLLLTFDSTENYNEYYFMFGTDMITLILKYLSPNSRFFCEKYIDVYNFMLCSKAIFKKVSDELKKTIFFSLTDIIDNNNFDTIYR